MKHSILPLVVSLALMTGCASDFQSSNFQSSRSGSTGSGSSASSYDDSVTTNDTTPPAYSPPDTSAQDAINQMNQQMATQQANDAAQQQFIAGMAAAQETENNANMQAPSN